MKTKIKIITASIVTFIVLLVCALSINLVKYSSAVSREKELEALLAELNAKIEQIEDEIEYKQTKDYIDRYARELLNLKGRDDKVFKSKD